MKKWTLLTALFILLPGACEKPGTCVDEKELVPRAGRYYRPGDREPYSGAVCGTHAGGAPALEGMYLDGLRSGCFSFRNSAGWREREETFVKGRLTLRKSWDGPGEQSGEQLEWWPNGQLKSRSTIYKGIPFLQTAWDSAGRKIAPEIPGG